MPARSGVLVGVDAGGSHTTAVVADRAGTVRGRATGPAGAVRPDAIPDAAAAIRTTVLEALAAAGATPPAELLVVGAAGAGRAAEREALGDALHDLAARVEVTTDGMIALEAACGEGPGIVLLAGTGSIAYARIPTGAVERVGGFGWQAGDEGGGYALGRAALSAAGKASDGRGPATVLGDALAAAAGVSGQDALVRWAAAATREAIAGLAAVVNAAAAGGDAVARALVDGAARELAEHVAALKERFPAGTPVPVALGGGLLDPGALRETLERRLQALPGCVLRGGTLDPAAGAVSLAVRLLR